MKGPAFAYNHAYRTQELICAQPAVGMFTSTMLVLPYHVFVMS
jgi:hypothetical protein